MTNEIKFDGSDKIMFDADDKIAFECEPLLCVACEDYQLNAVVTISGECSGKLSCEATSGNCEHSQFYRGMGCCRWIAYGSDPEPLTPWALVLMTNGVYWWTKVRSITCCWTTFGGAFHYLVSCYDGSGYNDWHRMPFDSIQCVDGILQGSFGIPGRYSSCVGCTANVTLL